MLTSLRGRLRNLFRRNRIESEIDAELRFHVEMAIQVNLAAGMTPTEARRVALRDLGGVMQTKEAVRDVRAGVLETIIREIRFASRALRRNPGYAVTAALTLALGIGANAAVFGIVDPVLLRRLPYTDPARIVRIQGRTGQEFISWGGTAGFELFPPELRHSRAFESIGAAVPGGLNLGTEHPQRVRTAAVTSGFFEALGARAALGRLFTAEDARHSTELAVISNRLWRTRFAADPALPGRTVVLNGQSFTITGVMPRGAEYPGTSEVWVPGADDDRIGGQVPTAVVVARLATGVTPRQAQDEVVRILPGRKPGARPPDLTVRGLRNELVQSVRPVFTLTVIAALLVLLVACINAAHLFLARAAAREREFAVRRALGASRGQIVRQLLVESLLVSAAAGLVAILAAAWTLRGVGRLMPPTLHGAVDIAVDGRVVAATAVLALLTAVLFGLAPALTLPSRGAASLLLSSLLATPDRVWRRFRSALVVAEIAIALVLLAGAATIVRTVANLMAVDIGTRSVNALAFDVTLPDATYPSVSSARQFYARLERELGEVPGVQFVGSTNQVPGDPDPAVLGERVSLPAGATTTESQPQRALRLVATPGYFAAAGIRRVAGRWFVEADGAGSPRVAIISEGVASLLGLQPENIVNRRLLVGTQSVEVVGVAGNVRLWGPERESYVAAVYLPFTQEAASQMHVVIKAKADPRPLVPAIRAATARVDPALPLYKIRTFDEIRAALLADRRFAMTGMLVFGGLAFGLSVLGLYGVLAYVVQQRTREIGIRMALGATASSVRRLVLTNGMTHAVGGIVLGLAAAAGSWRLVASRMPGLGHMDAPVLALLALAIAAVSALATWIPARRATCVDPVVTLRAE